MPTNHARPTKRGALTTRSADQADDDRSDTESTSSAAAADPEDPSAPPPGEAQRDGAQKDAAQTGAAQNRAADASSPASTTASAGQFAAAGSGIGGLVLVAAAAGVASHRNARAGRVRVNAARVEFLSPGKG
ncbi:hypothetical protein [Gordonia zhaorongruii]|uniref:hypothetical protein n=1 Tax=Gordonia zhaorongruii TaxID=2597659 RepID=UPI00104C8952|nr:hypothetical protein [Gordonia zhaorongruii]